MTRSLSLVARAWLCATAGLLLAAASMTALADPPTRAARLSFVSGSASFAPSGSDEWLQARINRPLWVGDRVWSADGRVELQLGGASLRLAPQTLLQILNFDDRIAQFEVTQGSVALHVRAIDRDDVIEIDTPSFAFVTREEGDYRIDVERDYTAVSTRRGNADIYGQDVAYRIDRRERFAFYSPDLRDYDAGPLPPSDGFDRWARERSQREDRSTSSRYVSPELVGFVDLDSYGEWRSEPTLGHVWIPRVAADWAPYRYGHWSWIDPWGWTWVDDAPWGFAPSHYGRWTQLGRSWAWVPGPRDVRPAYSPAMVAWVGGDNFSLTVSSGNTRGVGWFPLAPGEVWRPSYDVSREYFTRVNVANTVVNNTTIVNVYNNRNEARVSNADYRFRATRAAVTAVPVDTFVQGRPVQLTQAQLNANAAAQANVLPSAPARPVRQSIVGPAPRAQAKPPAGIAQRPVVARTAPAVMPTIDQRTALIREGKPVSRESLDRGGAQAATPQKPAPTPAGKAPAAETAQAPVPPPSAAPSPQRTNVRVVEAEKVAPKPLPEGGTRAARADEDRGRGKGAPPQAVQPSAPPQAQTARPGTEPAVAPPTRQATQPAPTPQTAPPARAGQAAPSREPEAARPAPPAATVPPGQRPPETRAPPPGSPAAGAVPTPKPAPAPAGSPPGRESAPPARANGESPSREPASPPPVRQGPPAAAPAPAIAPRSAQPAGPDPVNRRATPEAPPGRPATKPVEPPSAAPAPRPPVSAPTAATPGRGNDASERNRAGEGSPKPGRPAEERRAQPAQSVPTQTPPAVAPRNGAAPAARPAPPPAAAPAAQPPESGGRGERGNQPRPERSKDKEDKEDNGDKEKGKGKG